MYERTRKVLENIDVLIRRNHISIGDFESKLGVSPGYISRLKKEKKDPSNGIEFLCRSAEILDTSVKKLLYDDIQLEYDNIKKVTDFINRVIEMTEDKEIDWFGIHSAADILIRSNQNYGELKENIVETPAAMDYDCSTGSYFPVGKTVYKEEQEYKSMFAPGVTELDLACYGQIGDAVKLYVMSCVRNNKKGYEIYCVLEKKCTPIFDTFSPQLEHITMKIDDELITAIENSWKDVYLSPEAKTIMNSFMP